MSLTAKGPDEEERRLAALAEYELVETPPEPLFDAFTRLAAEICAAPFAAIVLLDGEREWCKSAFGLKPRQIPRERSLCAHGFDVDGVLEIEDAANDERCAQHPLVVGEPHVRFYAAVALRSHDGLALGSLTVMDRRPRCLHEEQRRGLVETAQAVVEQFEARRTLLRLFDSSQTELYHVDLAAQRILFASEAARRNLGYSAEELRRTPLAVLLPALARDGRLHERLAGLRTVPEGRLTLRTRARRKNGTAYPVELRVELVSERHRELVFVVAADLTEKERTQQRIHLLSAAIEAAQDPILIAKPGEKPTEPSTIVYANEAFVRQKGLVHSEDVIGKSTDTFFGAKTDRSRLAFMRREILAGRPARVDYVSYRSDGSTYHCEASARPLIDDTGRTTHFVVVQRDVTEQVLRGAELTMQNERLTTLTSIARTLFAALEPGVLVEALLAGARILLEGEATLYARRLRGGFAVTTDLSGPEQGTPGDAFVTLAAQSEVSVLDDFERRAAVRVAGTGGPAAYVLDVRRASAFESADLFALGLLGQYFAIAARNVESYRELAERRDAVVELNQVKNDLIAMLAHDFRGPLTSIVGFADVLAEDAELGDERRQYLRTISSSALRLAALASDTLALSRLEQNELELSLGDVDLAALVRDVVRVFGVTRSIELRVAPDRFTILADGARLRQVLENVVGNAIKYSPGGEPVEVGLRALPGAAEVTVRDRGIGIPEGQRGRLFSRFARADNARALGIGGTGFGLYLAKKIVEMHGGTIEVESCEGRGSLFRFVVPQRPPHRAAAPLRVALLDADGDARSYVAHALRTEGCAISVVTDGRQLLELLRAAAYDVALVDVDRLAMPPERFLAEAGRSIPLVALGARTPVERDRWSAFVAKPFLMADLYRAVETAADQTKGGRSSPSIRSAGSA